MPSDQREGPLSSPALQKPVCLPIGYGVCKTKGTFPPRSHNLPSSLGSGIPCSSGPEFDSRASLRLSLQLIPRPSADQGKGDPPLFMGGCGWRVHLQVWCPHAVCEAPGCRMLPEVEGGALGARSQRQDPPMVPHSDRKLQGCQEFCILIWPYRLLQAHTCSCGMKFEA